MDDLATIPLGREQRDRDPPAAAMSLPGVQAFPPASGGFRPALAIKPIQRDGRGDEIRVLDLGSGGILSHGERPEPKC